MNYPLNIQHPLTDEMCESIYDLTCEADAMMRFAYDLAIEHYSKWIYENGDDYVIQHYEHNIKTDLDTIVADFRKAMRQQEDN